MRVHVVSDVHGRADALPARGRRRGRPDLPRRPAAVRRLRRPREEGSSRTCSAPEAAREFIALRTAQRFDEARKMSAAAVGRARRRPGRARGGRGVTAVRGAVRRAARAVVPHLRQRRHTADVGLAPAARSSRARRRAGGAGRLVVRLRRRRAAHGVPDAERAGRRRSTRPRWRPSARWTCSARTSRPTYPNCCSTRWPAGWSGAARPCSTRCGRPSRGTSCSATCISRWPSRVKIGRTECINVGHFRATGTPYALEW